MLIAFALLVSVPAYGEEICFPIAVGTRMLQDIESLAVCRSAVEACEDAVNSCEARSSALEGRVSEQEEEIAAGKKTIEDTRKAGEQAVKVASGPWYAKVLSAGKWVALGALFGLAVGVAK